MQYSIIRRIRNLASLAAVGLLGLAFVAGCGDRAEARPEAAAGAVAFDHGDFVGYWNNGTAELTRYELSQARYGELHPGHTVLVFVTEEFRKDKQVKLESNDRAHAVPILKLNRVRKFATGIYDYSMMGSVFTPTEFSKHPRTLKVTTSSQEWCGHTFAQFNYRDGGYRLRQFSYFEAEGDADVKLPGVILEDALWTRLRLSPDLLPLGDVELFPGSFYLRMAHRPLETARAQARLGAYTGQEFTGKDLKQYTLDYADLGRKLEIVFDGEFPYAIAGWRETRMSGFGAGAKPLTTVARRTHVHRSPYWSENSLKDRAIRAKLGLPID